MLFQQRQVQAVALAAAAAPSLLAYNLPPSPTFLNQALALCLWGWFVSAAAGLGTLLRENTPLACAARQAWAPLLALALVAGAALASWAFGALPPAFALSALGLIGAAALLLLAGAAVGSAELASRLFVAFCWAWVGAGVLNVVIAGVQVFAPDWPDGDWLARSGVPGRAVGNLRQPNHLASLLVWSAVALVPLVELRCLARAWAWVLMAGLMLALVLSASRTGMLGVLILATWGALDRRLAPGTRALLLATPLLFALAWGLMAWWSASGGHAFGGAARLAEADLSGSRFGIWANTWQLVMQHPLLGVGFGEFNLAWSLTPFPGRSAAFFDHAHNLPLHLAAELGLPLATAVLALLGLALWQAWRRARRATGDASVELTSAWVMVAMIALHSQLEYPLWYAYFLLPAAWALGLGLHGQAAPAGTARDTGLALSLGGFALVLGAGLAFMDYLRVAAVFAPAEVAPPLAQRIEAGRRSLFFAHHADYAAATQAEPAPHLDAAFTSATHYLLDTRLMIAWAKHLAAQGRLAEARQLARRLREFHNPAAAEFFEPCSHPGAAASSMLFQCQAPQLPVPWRSYLR